MLYEVVNFTSLSSKRTFNPNISHFFYNFTGNEETVNLPSDNALAEGDRKNHEIPPPEPAPVSTPKPLERPPSPYNSEVVEVEDTVEHEEKAKFLDNVQVNLCV